jgi:hypothetical protein
MDSPTGPQPGLTGRIDYPSGWHGPNRRLSDRETCSDKAWWPQTGPARNRKARFDDINGHFRQLLGDSSFSLTDMDAPGDCSPSRKVVSKINTYRLT